MASSVNQQPAYQTIDFESKSCKEKCGERSPTKNSLIACVCVLFGLATMTASFVVFSMASSKMHIGQVLHISDPHLDQYYDSRISAGECRCHWNPHKDNCSASTSTSTSGKSGSFGCDSPPSLVRSAINAAADVAPGDTLPVLLSGDFTRHGSGDYQNPSNLVLDAFKNISSWMRDAGFKIVVSTWGNNDFRQNYYFDVDKKCSEQSLLAATSKFVASNLPNVNAINHMLPTSMECFGYYAYEIGDDAPVKIRILSLNTIMYSVNHQPKDLTNFDPGGQFQWMEDQLTACLQDMSCDAVWILGHVPPGREWCNGDPSWEEIYVKKYVSLLKKFSKHGIIKGQIFGHEHINSIRLIDADDLDIPPIIISAAISPVYSNRPSFRVIDYDRDRGGQNYGSILNFHVYGLKNDNFQQLEWEERFSGNTEFGLKNISGRSVLTWFNSFALNPTMNAPFQKFVTRSWDRDTLTPPMNSPCLSHPNICHLKYVLESDIVICISKEEEKEKKEKKETMRS